MKCRACWSDKAYLRRARGWERALCAALLLVPLRCQHCYHKFRVFRPFTWGRRLHPPSPPPAAPPSAATTVVPRRRKAA